LLNNASQIARRSRQPEGKMRQWSRWLPALMLLGCVVLGTTARGTTASAESRGGIPVGSGEFSVDAPRGPVTVFTYRPSTFASQSPIWVVMHGVRREAYRHIAFDYYDVWERLADRYGALLLVPEFTADKWPSAWSYNLGNVMSHGLLRRGAGVSDRR
jgi:poly(3-hydroxybutyrate) depolymerase